MADSVTYSDIKRVENGFSFTKQMARFSRRAEMVDGFNALVDGMTERNGFSSMWEAVRASSEDAGNAFYSSIRRYIDDVGNIDVCGMSGLANYAKMLSVDTDIAERAMPKEIRELVEIFSVNKAYLYNKATDGAEGTLTLPNTILSGTTVETLMDAFKDTEKWRKLVRDVFFNTLKEFVNIKAAAFSDNKATEADVPVWTTDISRFRERLWDDDITSDEKLYALKESLEVPKSFCEKKYADDIIAGTRLITDFTDAEKSVIMAEIESRQTRYSTAPQMRYHFMRRYKALEYFRFVVMATSGVHALGKYDLSATKFLVTDSTQRPLLIAADYGGYSLDESVLWDAAEGLADFCTDVLALRERLKSQCRRNMMVGTKKLLVDLIREFILENIDPTIWNRFRTTTIGAAKLNRDFTVDVVEYLDNTEYYNVEAEADVAGSKATLNPRFWDMSGSEGRSIDRDEVLSFYNRLSADQKLFGDGKNGGPNLFEFLSDLFNCGAVADTVQSANGGGDAYAADGGTDVVHIASISLEGDAEQAFLKYSGDESIGTTPWTNEKNSFHPSMQVHPFVMGFEEYSAAYTGVMNLVNSFTADLEESIKRLSERIDSLGNTINFWLNWNEDFTGYSTNFEKGGSDADPKLNQDGPFNFDALDEFVRLPDDFILNILSDSNKYYLDASSGKPLLNTTEKRLEVSRLRKFKDAILALRTKEIARYGKDRNGNIFLLYKSEGNRSNRNALGEVWVRMKDHPMAFPLFDLEESSEAYGQLSCLSESTNEKLTEVLKKVVNRFEPTYGVHLAGYADNRKVEADDLVVRFGKSTRSAYVTKGEGGRPVHPDLSAVDATDFEYGDRAYLAVESRDTTLLTFLDHCAEALPGGQVDISVLEDYPELSDMASAMEPLTSSEYFVDNVTNEVVAAGMPVSEYDVAAGVFSDAANETGQILRKPSDSYFCARFSGGKLSIEPASTERKYLAFADYKDTPQGDEGHTYYVESGSAKHPCTKHVVTMSGVVCIPSDRFVARIDTDGTAHFDLLSTTTERTEEIPQDSVVDGGTVYEDFDSYTYRFYNPDAACLSSYRHNPESGEAKRIIQVGGCNPYYVHTSSAEDGNNPVTTLIKAERVKGSELDSYAFADNTLYRELRGDNTGTGSDVGMRGFQFEDCRFTVPPTAEGLLDTTRQFYERDTPYVFYYPYTDVAFMTSDPGELNSAMPTGCVTFGDGEFAGVKFWYNLGRVFTVDGIDCDVYAKVVRTNVFRDVSETEIVKLEGGFIFRSDRDTVYPIRLSFSSEDGDANVASYSTLHSADDYVKFFDMGFSYDQRRMYLAFSDGGSEFEDGGMLIGDVEERESADFAKSLAFYRETSHNMEATEPLLMGTHVLMSEKVAPFLISRFPSLAECGKMSDFTFDELATEVLSVTVDAERVAAFKAIAGFPSTDFWYAPFTEFSAMTGDMLAENVNVFASDYIYDDDGNLVAEPTSFYAISGSMESVMRLDTDGYVIYPITELISNGGADTYAASGDAGNPYSPVSSGFALEMLDVLSEEVLRRQSSDAVKTVHVGDAVSKKGIFSVYGRFNAMESKVNLSVFLFHRNGVGSFNFELPFRFPLYEFHGDDAKKGIHSFKVACTENRLYIAATCQTPPDEYELSNGVNGGTGSTGSTTFGSIKNYCGDSVITILSFDIADVDNVVNIEDETRFVMSNGALGFIPQFGGFDGRNAVFTNPSLSSGDRFPFTVQFPPLEGSSSISLYETVEREFGKDSTTAFSKFVDVKHGDGTDGVLVAADHSEAYYIPTFASSATASTVFKNIDGRRIYDVSNTPSTYKLLSDAEDGSATIGAVVRDSDSVSVKRLPILAAGGGRVSTDFKSFGEDGDSVISLHSDGRTVSRLEIEDVGHDIFVKGFVDYTAASAIPSTQTAEFGDEGCIGFSRSALDSTACFRTEATSTEIVTGGTDENPTYSYVEHEYSRLTYLGAYGSDEPLQANVFGSIPNGKPIPFFIGNVPFYIKFDHSEYERDYYRMVRVADGGEGESTTFYINTNHHMLTGVEDTHDPEVKLLCTASLRVYRMDVSWEDVSVKVDYARTFDKLVADGVVDGTATGLDGYTTMLGRSSRYDLVGWKASDRSKGGVLYIRSEIPDSVGISSMFDVDGVVDVTRIVSYGNIVLAEENYSPAGSGGTTRIHLSEDGGETFHLIDGLSLVGAVVAGCFDSALVVQFANGMVATSVNGRDWTSSEILLLSRWAAFSACGRSYAACVSVAEEVYDGSSSFDKCVRVKAQTVLDGEYDGLVLDGRGGFAAYGGLDGSPMRLAKSAGVGETVEYFRYDHVRNMLFSSARAFDGSVFFAPDGGSFVLRLTDAFADGYGGGYDFIDISDANGSGLDSFGGFVVLGSSLFMFPRSGRRLLVYNRNDNRFYNYLNFQTEHSFVDGDEVSLDGEHSVVLTEASSIGGTAYWTRLVAADRTDFAMVELDEGFPIMVTYVKNTREFTAVENGEETTRNVVSYEFTFSFVDDERHGRVTIATFPTDVNPEFAELFSENTSRSASYTVGGRTITYTFSTVDDTPKYVITKGDTVRSEAVVADNYLDVTFFLDAETRADAANRIVFDYLTSDSDCWCSVYKDFEDGYGNYRAKLGPSNKSIGIGLFRTYGFSDTVAFLGAYEKLLPSSASKLLVKNSNLKFNETFLEEDEDGSSVEKRGASVSTAASMFEGCVAARFDQSMVVRDSRMYRADRMFYGCTSAQLPSVDLGGAVNLFNADSMFENCKTASLDTVMLPSSLISAERMFAGCTEANLYEINLKDTSIRSMDHMFDGCSNAVIGGAVVPESTISAEAAFKNCRNSNLLTLTSAGNVTNCREMFYGCAGSAFSRFSFKAPSDGTDEYDIGYMFWHCSAMNPSNLGFDSVSPYVVHADFAFAGTGASNPRVFNGKLFRFNKLMDADGIFDETSYSFDGSAFQFFGERGFVGEGSGIPSTSTVSSIRSFFGNNAAMSENAPKIVLCSDNSLTLETLDGSLSSSLTGHYSVFSSVDEHGSGTNYFNGGIVDFSGLYSSSPLVTADIRGICNNVELLPTADSGKAVAVQRFDSMFENCTRLETIQGYIPPYASSCHAMFKGCSSLEADISDLFRIHESSFEDMNTLKRAFSEEKAEDGTAVEVDNPFYNFEDISYMFYGCGNIYTRDDGFDLARIAKKLYDNHVNDESSIENFYNGDTALAMYTTIPALTSLVYSVDTVASDGVAMRYASTPELYSLFGVGSWYTRTLFKSGFYRYCGRIESNMDEVIDVMYYPILDESGRCMALAPEHGKIDGAVPEDFALRYKTRKTSEHDDYYSFRADDLYAARITNTATGEKRFAYVGEWTLEHHYEVLHSAVLRKRHHHHHHHRTVYWYTEQTDYFKMPAAVFSAGYRSVRPL